MAKYQQYEEYKDSGVEWLGEIPSHWNLSSLKRCVDGCTNGIWGSEPEESSDNTVVLRVADFDRDKLEISEEKLTLRNISPKERENRLLRKGDLLIEKSGGGDKTLVGCVVLFDKDFRAVTSNFVAKMTPKINYESSFLKYAFSLLYDGRVNYASIKQTTGIQNLDSDAYLMEKFVFPEKEEQIQIANFLDHETAQIDTLIEKQQTLIQLLKEKRQAVISHAVTKGLNPDAPMKDSGVEWLGEVPEHWRVCSLKHIKAKQSNAFVDGPFGSNLKSIHFVDDGDIFVIESNFATTGIIDESKLKNITLSHFNTISRSEAKAGDIIIAKIGARFGMSSILPKLTKRSVVSGNSLKLTLDSDICNTEYIKFLLQHLKNEGAMDDGVNVTAQPALSLGGLNNLPVLLPPYSEQNAVIEELHRLLYKLSDLTNHAEQAIQLMQERRTALISAAVTGKIDVRGWVAPDVDSLE